MSAIRHARARRTRHGSRRAPHHPGGGRAAAAAEGFREQAIPRDGRRAAVLLAGRHGMGAVPPPQSRGRRALPEESRRPRFTVIQAVALAEFDGLGDAERLRAHAAPQQRPDAAERGRTSPHVDWIVARANALGMYVGLAADLGRQVEPAAGRRARDLHARKRRTLRRVARAALQGRRASSGFSAAIGRSRRTRIARSCGRWPADCARATAART